MSSLLFLEGALFFLLIILSLETWIFIVKNCVVSAEWAISLLPHPFLNAIGVKPMAALLQFGHVSIVQTLKTDATVLIRATVKEREINYRAIQGCH